MLKNRIEREKQTVGLMIRLYCRRAEGNKELCDACSDLLDYSLSRLDHCPYGDNKPSCKKCTTHCYNPTKREYIRRVMLFSGSRMILYAPMATIRHIRQVYQ